MPEISGFAYYLLSKLRACRKFVVLRIAYYLSLDLARKLWLKLLRTRIHKAQIWLPRFIDWFPCLIFVPNRTDVPDMLNLWRRLLLRWSSQCRYPWTIYTIENFVMRYYLISKIIHLFKFYNFWLNALITLLFIS